MNKSEKRKIRAKQGTRRYILKRDLENMKPSHKSCPFCGKTRRAGYFNACPACYPAFQLQNAAGAVLMQLGNIAKSKGYKISWEFPAGMLVIYAKTQKAVQSIDGFGKPEPRGSLYNYTASASVSLRELQGSRLMLKDVLMQMCLGLFERLEAKAQEQIDNKGQVVNICGVGIPAAGTWNFNAPFTHKRGY